MKNRKLIIIIVLLLAVGFAAVSTTLYINGNTNINPNQDDFDVYYSDAYVNGVQDKSVITDDTHIVFETELTSLGQKYVLDYEVTNGSKNYDAELVMECTQGNDYLSVTNVFDDDSILKAKAKRDGKLTLELIKSYAGEEDLEVSIECTINANAIERDSLGIENRSEITVEAVDSNNTNLNAKAYEITGSEETALLDSLVETGYVTDASEVDALIEVKSDEFENFATTTFDVSSIAEEGDKVVILHFNEETQEWEYIGEEIVDAEGKVTGDFTSYSPVAFVVKKEDGTLEVIKTTYEIGDEVTLAGETFNVISQTDDTVTLLASNVLGTDYRQTESTNPGEYGVAFSSTKGWENTPGPKEIDIQTWSTNPKTYVNEYITYLQSETGSSSIIGNLITLAQLKALGCTINDDYSYTSGLTCANSSNASWLVNGQYWWTRSAYAVNSTGVWIVDTSGVLSANYYYSTYSGVRPVITISKSDI